MIEGRKTVTEPGLQAAVFFYNWTNHMDYELTLSPTLFHGRMLQDADALVAVDVLRASSAICAAFMAGVEEIVPLGTLEELPSYRALGYLLAAERNGEKVYGAQCGNSPTEYLTMDLTGQRLAYSTTNGTVAIRTAAKAEGNVYVGCFANLTALARVLAKRQKVVVLCSGWKGEPSTEDTLFGGALAAKIEESGVRVERVNDAATMASTLWSACKGDPTQYCRAATHVERLRRLGCEADIAWSLQIDSCPMVPAMEEGRLKVVGN